MCTSSIRFWINSSMLAVTSSVIVGAGLTLCSKSRSTSSALFFGLFAAVTCHQDQSIRFIHFFTTPLPLKSRNLLGMIHKLISFGNTWTWENYLPLHCPGFWLQVRFLHFLNFRTLFLRHFLKGWKIFSLLFKGASMSIQY